MAEAATNLQASNVVNIISIETVTHTVAQLEENCDRLGASKPPGNQLANASTLNHVDSPALENSVMLKTLQDIAGQFKTFQQQAQEDRLKVARLYEQFEAQNQTVLKKPKTSARKSSQKNLDSHDSNVSINKNVHVSRSLFSTSAIDMSTGSLITPHNGHTARNVQPNSITDTSANTLTDVVNIASTQVSDSTAGRGGARPRTSSRLEVNKDTAATPCTQQLMTYEQFLAIQQAQQHRVPGHTIAGDSHAPICGQNFNIPSVSAHPVRQGVELGSLQAQTSVTQLQPRVNSLPTQETTLRTSNVTQPTTDVADEHNFLPPLASLQQTADIQQRVQQRYKELEDQVENPQGTVGNLVNLLVKNSVKNKENSKLKWPQDHVYVGIHRRNPTYDQLEECQWFLGFLKQRQAETDHVIREHMIEYLVELMQDAVDFGWPSAKGAHFVLVHRIGDGMANWSDISSVHKIRERYTKTANQKTDTNHLKPVPCFKFNRNGCSESRDHAYKNLLLKHACQACFNATGAFEGHSRRNCPKNQNYQKNFSKNV